MPERWTIYVCTGCGKATGRHKDCDALREAVEVVPAIELAAAEALIASQREEIKHMQAAKVTPDEGER